MTICTLCVMIYAGSRYGWRLFGFAACENPASLYVAQITINDNTSTVEITGHTAASAPAYVGATWQLNGGCLSVGLKYNLLIGFLGRNGAFHVTIPVDTATITEIVLTNGKYEKVIWEKGSPESELAFD